MQFAPPGGGMEIMLSLLLNGALVGELDKVCDVFRGEPLLPEAVGALSTMFVLDEAFLIDRNGEVDLGSEEVDGIGAWSDSGS